MRFTGQVKIPDLDYPGVPAVILVDGKQTELFVEGESLGRWSLVDVRAERLISSAFSLKLAGEEITFIADQPTEFAYAGVDQMAKVWAKHKTMRLPLRVVADNRSRRGTKPSRIDDLRSAIDDAISGNPLTALPKHQGSEAEAPVSREAETAETGPDRSHRIADFKPARPTSQEGPVEADLDAPAVESSPEETGPQPAEQPAAAVEHDPVTIAPDTPDSIFASASDDPTTPLPRADSVYKDSVPWAKTDSVPESPPAAQPSHAEDQPVVEPPAPVDPWEERADPAPTVRETPAARQETPPATTPVAPTEPPPSESVPWIAPSAEEVQRPADRADGPTEADHRPAADQAPEPGISRPGVPDPPPARAGSRPSYVVDLGAFEDRDEADTADDSTDSDAPEPALASAASKGGIMGAVRSAFVRNRNEHTHEYVEAPGGLGIKRQICSECGHISIGMSQ